MEKRDVAEAIIVNNKNEVLLQKKTLDYLTVPGGYWTVFGGGIEDSENPEQALKREVKEEIAFNINKFKLFKIKDYKLPTGFYGKRYIFEVLFDKEISNIILKEGAGFAFFDISEINSIKVDPLCLGVLKEYFLEQQSLITKKRS
jgi:mutator protein MutT